MTKKKKEKKKNIKFLYNLYDVKKWKKKLANKRRYTSSKRRKKILSDGR